jgi:hypothetical protein
MDPLDPPTVITAIADPDFEGLVSRALYSQGWNVVSRVMNFAQVNSAISKNRSKSLLLIFSTDLPGVTPDEIEKLASPDISIFGFADHSGSAKGFLNIFSRPISPDDLILIILENIRSAGVRSPLIHQGAAFNSNLVAVGGAGHATGNTTLAINLAYEAALLGVKTLLIDANFQAPAVAALLDLRKLSSEPFWREVSEGFAAMEFTQETIKDFEMKIMSAGDSFDQIVIDLGSVAYLSRELADRRWSSAVKIWTSRRANSFIVTTNSSFLAQKRLEEFSNSFSKLNLSSDIHLANQRSSNKNGENQELLRKHSLQSSTLWTLPWDLRSCQQAIEARATLAQVAERGALRREIAKMAQAVSLKSRK